MAKNKQYKVVTKRPLGMRLLKAFLKLFVGKSKLINLSNQPLPQKAIYIMNHCGARGPLVFELRFPVVGSPWGAHQMCGSYRERWNYLYRVFYTQKLHWNKFKAFTVATLFAIISKWIYNSIGLIGTYTDVRLIGTMRNSISVLNNNLSIVIFPEDSAEGYLDKPKSFSGGFIELSKMYFKRTGEDLPVYCMYYTKKKNTFVVDKPEYINALLKDGKTEDELAALFLQKNHALYDGHIKPLLKKRKK